MGYVLPRGHMSTGRITTRASAFTMIELVTVISIIMILAAAVVPAIMPSFRQGQVQSSGEAIVEAWRRARLLARRESNGLTGIVSGAIPHYGVAIIQTATGTEVGLIKAATASSGLGSSLATSLLRRDPTNTSTNDTTNPPVFVARFPSGVVLATAMNETDPLNAGAQSWVVYARYGSGEPLTGQVVAAGTGATAAPAGFGVPGIAGAQATGMPAVVRVKGNSLTSKAVTSVAIFHIGFAANDRP